MINSVINDNTLEDQIPGHEFDKFLKERFALLQTMYICYDRDDIKPINEENGTKIALQLSSSPAFSRNKYPYTWCSW